jgi:hypothetical protein
MIDAELANRARAKQGRGEKLSREENSALRQSRQQAEDALRRRFYAAIPQKHWRELCGRQTKTLHDQARRYGAPTGGATIDLGAFLRWYYDWVADNAVRLAADDPEDPGWLEKGRKERALLLRLERLSRRGELLPRSEVRAMLAIVASVLRNTGRRLEHDFGRDAAVLMEEGLDEAEAAITKFCGALEGANQDGQMQETGSGKAGDGQPGTAGGTNPEQSAAG